MQNSKIIKVPCYDRILEYHLTRKPVKNINLRIKSDGQIHVSASSHVPIDYINDFVRENQEKIIKLIEIYERKRKKISSLEKQYVDGECFYLLGKELRLKIIQGLEEGVKADENFIYLIVKDKDNKKRKENLMNSWLKQIQIDTFNQISMEVHEIFKKYKIEYPHIKIRKMKTRWGSCHINKKIITLNSKLIEAPRKSIEYVVLHEFAHFIHPNHSRKFHEFVESLMPGWKDRKKELENIILF